ALTSLSAVWSGQQPAAISSSLANILRSGLDAELVEVRVGAEYAPYLSRAVRPDREGRDDALVDSLSGNAAVNRDYSLEGLVRTAQAPLGYDGEFGSVKVWSRSADFPDELQRLFLNVAVNQAAMALQAHSLVTSEQTMRRQMERLFQLGQTISAELDRDRLLQRIIDAASELCGAQVGSFFYNVIDERGASCLLFALSGAPPETWSDLL